MSTASGTRRKATGRKTALRYYVVATNRQYARLCERSLTRTSKGTVNVFEFHDWTTAAKLPPQVTKSPQQTIFVSRLADISEEAAKKTTKAPGAKYLLFSEGMPVEALPSRLSRLNIRDDQRLHVARQDREVAVLVSRLLSGLSAPERKDQIVDAWIEDDSLVLLNPAFERLTVPLELLAKYIGRDEERIRAFEIDEDGSFLYWKHADAHFGWTQLLHLVNPAAAFAAKEKTKDFNRRYGEAIRSLREERGLTQAQIEGLADRHLRRIERGLQGITAGAIGSLAAAHGMTEAEYLDEISKRLK